MEQLVLQYSYLFILRKYLDKMMDIFKVSHCLYQYYYETLNSYLNDCLLKVVVLVSNHENHLLTIFLHKNICILVILFLKSTFFITPFP